MFEAYNNIGNAFKYQNKFKEAIEAYEKAISLNLIMLMPIII